MTYRGVYRNGVVVLEDDTGLRNGTRVEVNPASRPKRPARDRTRSRATKSARRNKTTKRQDLPGFGIWKNRWPKSMGSAEAARDLRAKVSKRTR